MGNRIRGGHACPSKPSSLDPLSTVHQRMDWKGMTQTNLISKQAPESRTHLERTEDAEAGAARTRHVMIRARDPWSLMMIATDYSPGMQGQEVGIQMHTTS